MDEHRRNVLAGIDFTREIGVEIGPLTAPIVTEHDGQILYVDHVDTESLKRKYADDPNVDTSAIVPVHRVVHDGDLKASLQSEAPLDYVVASHVIEHIPDPLSWLNDVAFLLKEGGKLRLVIPDYRFTFDVLRQPTTTAEWMDWSSRKLVKPSSSALSDYLFFTCTNQCAWGPDVRLTRSNPLERVLRLSQSSDEYVDAHNSVFDPSSFLRLMMDLCIEGFCPYVCWSFADTAINTIEFIVILEKRSAPSRHDRQHMQYQARSYQRFLRESPLLREGTFVRHRGALYLIQYGRKRYVSHTEVIPMLAFFGYQFSEANVLNIEDRDFDSITMGVPLYRSITYIDSAGMEYAFKGSILAERFYLSDFYCATPRRFG